MSRFWFAYLRPDAAERLVRVAATAGVICSKLEAVTFWQHYSEQHDAGWLGLPASDAELAEIIAEATKKPITV